MQRCKLLRHLGTKCPVGFGTSSRILNANPTLGSRIFTATYALFAYLWVKLPDFQNFWVDFGFIWTNFEHFLTAFISSFWVDRVPSRQRIICRSDLMLSISESDGMAAVWPNDSKLFFLCHILKYHTNGETLYKLGLSCAKLWAKLNLPILVVFVWFAW